MKIKKLVVKGFMRFKEQQEVIFPENQVTLIFGENGAGKTSLLDAICVGLYGRTFRTSFDPEAGFVTTADLVNHESTKASIHIEFENYGHNFVVKHEITRNNSNGELLEDGEVKAQDEGVFDYVTTKALGLDWQGFTKSTVILQGEMNALTDALPATRKEMFVKLFGLEKYSSYEQIAKIEMEKKNLYVKELEAANTVLANEVAKIPQVKSSIKRLDMTMVKLQQQKTSSMKKVKRLTKFRSSLERDYSRYTQLNAKIDNITTQITNVEKAVERKKNGLKQLTALQGNFNSIKKSYDLFFSLTKSLRSMKTSKSRYDRLGSKMTTLKNLLKYKKEKLAQIRDDTTISKTLINKLKKQIPSPKEIVTVREEMASLERRKLELEENRYQVTALLNIAINTVNELKKNMSKIKHSHICLVCNQKISNTRDVLEHYTKEVKSLGIDIRKKRTRLKSVYIESRKMDQKLVTVETAKNKLESVYSIQSELLEERERLDVLSNKGDKIKKEVSLLSEEIEKYRKQIRSLRFNVMEYYAMEKRIASLRQDKAAEKFFDVKAQLKQLPKLEREISEIKSSLSKMEKERKGLLAQIKKLRDIENRFTVVKEELQSAENVYNKNMVTLVKEQTNYKTLAKQHIELKNKEKKLQHNENEIETLRAGVSVFEELVFIFRDIPENILKRLIPQVEKEGTAIINELSEGVITTINIDSERLNIGATMGGEVRPIQYFSGGQQTRINMALRIAISRILSNISHTETQSLATMQTLFIDEGDFGNLDEVGVRDSVGVIHSLTKEFDRIVLTSHLESLRTSFQGYTVEVVKTTPSQSVINVPMEAISMQHKA